MNDLERLFERFAQEFDQHDRRLEALEMAGGGSTAMYEIAAPASVGSGTPSRVNYSEEKFDPAEVVTVGTDWSFTAIDPGIYAVSAMVRLAASTAWAAGETCELALHKNGALYKCLDYKDNLVSGGTAISVVLRGLTLVELAAGDTLYLQISQASGESQSLDGVKEYNYVDIWRIA